MTNALASGLQMERRLVEKWGATREESEDAASAPESDEVLAQIEKLGQLHDAGVLTDQEFQAKKAVLLSRL